MATHVNWSKQLILAAFLLVFGTFAYWLEYKHKPDQEDQEEEAKRIFAIADTSIAKILLSGKDRTYELHCLELDQKLCKPGDQSKWELESPIKIKADTSNANSLLSALKNLSSSETINLLGESEEKRKSMLSDYGLSEEARAQAGSKIIAIETADTKKFTLYMGADHPIGGKLFAWSPESPDKVFLLPSGTKSHVERELTYWRDKKLFSWSSHDVTSFNLMKGKESPIKAVKKDGKWILGADVSGDTETIESLLNSVVFLNAKEFVSDNKSGKTAHQALNGTKPVVSLELVKILEAKDQEPAKTEKLLLELFEKAAVNMAKDQPRIFAKVSNLDPLFELPSNAKNLISKSLKDLRQTKLITSMDRYAAKRLEFTGKPIGDPPVSIIQANSKWALESPADDPHDINEQKIQKLLDKMSGKSIKAFLSGTSIPTGEDEGLKLSLTLADSTEKDKPEEKKREFLFWKKNDQVYARDLLSVKQEAFHLEASLKEVLPWERTFFENETSSDKKEESKQQ